MSRLSMWASNLNRSARSVLSIWSVSEIPKDVRSDAVQEMIERHAAAVIKFVGRAAYVRIASFDASATRSADARGKDRRRRRHNGGDTSPASRSSAARSP